MGRQSQTGQSGIFSLNYLHVIITWFLLIFLSSYDFMMVEDHLMLLPLDISDAHAKRFAQNFWIRRTRPPSHILACPTSPTNNVSTTTFISGFTTDLTSIILNFLSRHLSTSHLHITVTVTIILIVELVVVVGEHYSFSYPRTWFYQSYCHLT